MVKKKRLDRNYDALRRHIFPDRITQSIRDQPASYSNFSEPDRLIYGTHAGRIFFNEFWYRIGIPGQSE